MRALLLALLLISPPLPAGARVPGSAGSELQGRRDRARQGADPGESTLAGGAADRLRGFTEELRGSGALGSDALSEAAYGLNGLGLAWSGRPEVQEAQAIVVLDLLGLLLERERAGLADGPAWQAEAHLLQSAMRLLTRELDGIRRYLAFELAPMARRHPDARRAAACRVLGRDESTPARMALFTCTRDESRLVRDEAVAALSGRDDPAVHELLIGMLERAELGELELTKGPIERHFRGASLSRLTETHARVAGVVRRGMTSESWRRASRAISVSRCLDDRTAAPMLIETLSIWITRAAAGVPSRRIQGELLRELERRSGRRLGLKPERWRQWWAAVQEGRIGFEGHVEGQASFTQAGFFGLRPMTDRVTFVLDRSGSMEGEFGDGTYSGSDGSGRTRLREAVTQMSRCLEQLGPETRFGVVLFSDGARVWRRDLQAASVANISAAGRWVLDLGPGGGTNLRPGIEAAMHVKAGAVDLDALESDTVIVLCDGETSEGSAWVQPFLRRNNDEARVLFHAVRIGGTDAGSLKALCEESGGDFISVDG